jgi:hypothetical protein
MNNSQNCARFDANVDNINRLTEPKGLYNFILPQYTKQAFINGYISYYSQKINIDRNINVIINNNSFTLKTWKKDEEVEFSCKFVKWSALNDCAIFISGSGGKSDTMTIYPSVDIQKYSGRVAYDDYERSSVEFNLHWNDESDNFIFFLSKFDFTNIHYNPPE